MHSPLKKKILYVGRLVKKRRSARSRIYDRATSLSDIPALTCLFRHLAADRQAAHLKVKGAALRAAGDGRLARARAVAARPEGGRLAGANRHVGPAQAARAHGRVAARAEAESGVAARAAVLQRHERARVAAALRLGGRRGQRGGARGGHGGGEGGGGSEELHCWNGVVLNVVVGVVMVCGKMSLCMRLR